MSTIGIKIYNTLTRKKELFRPLRKDWVGLYTCGPTVYSYAHIGNLRTYIFEDVLRRTLEYAGYRVKHVMNITDVGHLTSDEDMGEDKVEREARKEGKTVRDIARYYTNAFLKDTKRLNIEKAQSLLPATRAIKEQIRIIEQLFKKGYAYETEQAVYFDVSKFRNYTKLSRQKLSEKITGAREEVIIDPQKRNPYDFALWFKLVGRFKNHIMHWGSPWGEGFPGWHIECSAISTKFLGQPFDIHTGGVDHVALHHTNEIAQSEGAYDKPLAKTWMHGEFLLVDRSKMAKSEGNFITLETLIEKGFNPLAFRYLMLTAHYRSKLNFSRESLEAAQKSLERLYDFAKYVKNLGLRKTKIFGLAKTLNLSNTKKKFEKALFNDLDTPKALAVVWGLVNQYNKNPKRYNTKEVLRLLYDFDRVLGLGLKEIKPEKIPKKILALVEKREEYREEKMWKKADNIRRKLLESGWVVEDTTESPKVKKNYAHP